MLNTHNMPPKNHILIVEDEKNLGVTLQEYLTSKGYSCSWAQNSIEAQKEFLSHSHPSIILMDIGLPDGSGLLLAEEFRKQRKDFVLLFLSAQNDPETKVQGLEIGAHDYITKPFALKELTLRLERILKSQQDPLTFPDEISHGSLKIWFNRFEVQDAQQRILPLSQKENAILKLLYQKQNHAVSREQIIDEVWGEDSFPSMRTVDNYIVKLRKWCETDPTESLQIESIRGIGYKLKVNY